MTETVATIADLDALQASLGSNTTIAAKDVVAYEKANGLKHLSLYNLAGRSCERAGRGMFDLSKRVSAPTKPAKAQKVPKEPKPKKVREAKEKAAKPAKDPNAPKLSRNDTGIGQLKYRYDDLVSLRRDFEAMGYPTLQNKHYCFTNEFGRFGMLAGQIIPTQADGTTTTWQLKLKEISKSISEASAE